MVSEMKDQLFAYLGEVDAQMPVKNPIYDPENAPVLKEMRGDRKGGGGKGGKGKKRMAEKPETPTPSSDEPDTPTKTDGDREQATAN